MPDTSIDLATVISTYGLAVFLIVIIALFVVFKWWPWYVKRTESRDADENRRHSEYMNVIADFSKAMQAVNVTMSTSSQMIAAMTDRMDDNHKEILYELRSKR